MRCLGQVHKLVFKQRHMKFVLLDNILSEDLFIVNRTALAGGNIRSTLKKAFLVHFQHLRSLHSQQQ